MSTPTIVKIDKKPSWASIAAIPKKEVVEEKVEEKTENIHNEEEEYDRQDVIHFARLRGRYDRTNIKQQNYFEDK